MQSVIVSVMENDECVISRSNRHNCNTRGRACLVPSEAVPPPDKALGYKSACVPVRAVFVGELLVIGAQCVDFF